jgi:hypothetical protein
MAEIQGYLLLSQIEKKESTEVQTRTEGVAMTGAVCFSFSEILDTGALVSLTAVFLLRRCWTAFPCE